MARPVLAFRAAIWLRTCPPQVGTVGFRGSCWNAPPTYTFPSPGTKMARTGPWQTGAHEVGGCPVPVVSTAAILPRACPPTELKLPATYSVLPDMNMARTIALLLG